MMASGLTVSSVTKAAVSGAQSLGFTIKQEQLDVVVKFAMGRDVFAVLPTGYGKTLCYQCLPRVFNQICFGGKEHFTIIIVVSPLVAIMQDQVKRFNLQGVLAALVTGTSEDKEIKKGIHGGKYDIVFFTPELLITSARWRRLLTSNLYAKRLKGLVIDEAHCVSKWGDTFRTLLRRMGEVRSLLPVGVHVMALTATATKSVRQAVSGILGMRNPHVIAYSPCKKNLMYAVSTIVTLEESFKPVVTRLRSERTKCPRMILYARSFDMCSNIYLYFKTQLGDEFTEPKDAPDISRFRLVDMYTSIVEKEHKESILHLFTKDSHLRIVIATIAFGMGVDLPDVRQVIHVAAPDDVESYIQETGRAGRDGLPSLALLLHVKGSSYPLTPAIKEYKDNKDVCRRDCLFEDTDHYEHVDLGKKCLCCDVCMKFCECGVCESEHNSFLFL